MGNKWQGSSSAFPSISLGGVQIKWERGFQSAMKNGYIKGNIALQGVQSNNLQLSINKILAEVQCPFVGITFQKRDVATGEIQRKRRG